jgi:hypothetical protein
MAKLSRFAQAVQEVISLALDPLLTPLGFKKARTTYRRTVGTCVQVVNVQSSQFQTVNARFTVNVGVDFPAARKLAVGLLPAAGPSSIGMLSKRIGSLMPGGCDHWWEVRPGASLNDLEAVLRAREDDRALPVDTVVSEVRAAVRDLALPWLEAHADPRKVQGLGAGRHAIALALMLGDEREARRLAKEHLKRAPGDELLREWAKERGLHR